MKIGFFVSEVAVPKGADSRLSAHVQIPVHSMNLLRDAGHSVQLITTEIAREEVLPNCIPATVPLHEVADARRKDSGQSRVRPIKLMAKCVRSEVSLSGSDTTFCIFTARAGWRI